MADQESSRTEEEFPGYNKDDDVIVYRTDTSNPEKWNELKELVMKNEFRPSYFYVDAPDIPIEELPLLTDEMTFIVLADDVTMSDHTFVVVDRESGQKLRVQAEFLADITNNLSIANMDFYEFEDSAQEDGVFRGFP